MGKEEAINILSEVCATVRADLKQHQAMQVALQTVRTLVVPVEKDIKKTRKKLFKK